MNKMLAIIVISSIAVVGLITFAVLQMEEKNDNCTAKGGVVVKTLEGWRCIESRIIPK